jgi:hypothetical protein
MPTAARWHRLAIASKVSVLPYFPAWVQEFTKMVEQRRHIRVPSSALIEMQHPVLGLIEVKARDLSDGGICALMGSLPAPPIGTELMVRIKRYTGTINQAPIRMRVVHHQLGGVGLTFIR